MLPYLQMAETDHVEHFAISTELQSMANKPNWQALITKARHVYKRDLVFSTNWAPDEHDGIHWTGTSVGLDLYSAVPGLGTTATPAQIMAGWNRELATTNPFPLVNSATISETGILPQDGAYAQPYTWSLPLTTNPFNQAIQANWFTAVCRFFKSHDMGGVYFWGSAIYEQGGALLTSPSESRGQRCRNTTPRSAGHQGMLHRPVSSDLGPDTAMLVASSRSASLGPYPEIRLRSLRHALVT